MMYAAKVMALSAAELIISPELLERAQAEFQAALERTPYVCPIPENVGPPTTRPSTALVRVNALVACDSPERKAFRRHATPPLESLVAPESLCPRRL